MCALAAANVARARSSRSSHWRTPPRVTNTADSNADGAGAAAAAAAVVATTEGAAEGAADEPAPPAEDAGGAVAGAAGGGDSGTDDSVLNAGRTAKQQRGERDAGDTRVMHQSGVLCDGDLEDRRRRLARAHERRNAGPAAGLHPAHAFRT